MSQLKIITGARTIGRQNIQSKHLQLSTHEHKVHKLTIFDFEINSTQLFRGQLGLSRSRNSIGTKFFSSFLLLELITMCLEKKEICKIAQGVPF